MGRWMWRLFRRLRLGALHSRRRDYSRRHCRRRAAVIATAAALPPTPPARHRGIAGSIIPMPGQFEARLLLLPPPTRTQISGGGARAVPDLEASGRQPQR
jgi:hypothetical protein